MKTKVDKELRLYLPSSEGIFIVFYGKLFLSFVDFFIQIFFSVSQKVEGRNDKCPRFFTIAIISVLMERGMPVFQYWIIFIYPLI